LSSELVALLGDWEVGQMRRDREGRLSFRYDEAWRGLVDAHPLSVSMPLAKLEHGHDVVSAFLQGLLPDHPLILERWAKRLGVSASNPLALLGRVGADCAGAVRFAQAADVPNDVAWLDDGEVAARLRLLQKDVSAWRRPDDAGQFSLAGAKPKTALHYVDGRFGVPSGNVPTTHILKPGRRELDGHAENEHFCLLLARAAGLPVPSSRVMRFEDQVAVVVERYDRVRTKAGVTRVHQEDLAQALAVSAEGSGARAIIDVLRQHSRRPEEDTGTFIRALAFHFLIGGTEANAKNYSLLFGAQGWVRLAPLYDLTSALPYLEPHKLKLAMDVGGKYRLRNIGAKQWRKLARDLDRDADEVLAGVTGLARALPDHAADSLRQCREDGLHHSVLKRLLAAIRERSAGWLQGLTAA
jgi:serine/threonine-protein kinase HipA